MKQGGESKKNLDNSECRQAIAFMVQFVKIRSALHQQELHVLKRIYAHNLQRPRAATLSVSNFTTPFRKLEIMAAFVRLDGVRVVILACLFQVF